MPKVKTHKGLRKVLNIRQSGSITKNNAVGQHKTGKKKAAVIRRKAAGSTLSDSDLKRFKEKI